MKLEEAIEINESLLDGTYDHRDEVMEEALKLGIEALKFIKALRGNEVISNTVRLQGETKE